MGTKRIDMIRIDKIRAIAGVANISKKMSEARPRSLGIVERKR